MNPLRDSVLDMAKFNYLWPKAYPYYSRIPFLTKVLTKLVADDIIQFGQLFEKAIERQCGLVRESTYGKDFELGQDAKCVSVRTSSAGTRYSANVSNVHSKTGTLLISCYEKKNDKWYLFRIPRKAYSHIPKTSNIEIPFELDGTPRRLSKRRDAVQNWWNFEVKSFKQLGL